MKLVVVLTTEANQAKAEALAAQLLEQRLAACIALQPQQSLYHWQGRIEQDSEVQLVIKTNAERLEPCRPASSARVKRALAKRARGAAGAPSPPAPPRRRRFAFDWLCSR